MNHVTWRCTEKTVLMESWTLWREAIDLRNFDIKLENCMVWWYNSRFTVNRVVCERRLDSMQCLDESTSCNSCTMVTKIEGSVLLLFLWSVGGFISFLSSICFWFDMQIYHTNASVTCKWHFMRSCPGLAVNMTPLLGSCSGLTVNMMRLELYKPWRLLITSYVDKRRHQIEFACIHICSVLKREIVQDGKYSQLQISCVCF